MKRTGGGDGEIIQVQGGHIIRATGRKDRHSKVYTAKGPRDRRVRLSAHTAIQFYDVQDRLGYDRPSKAVDWLIKKAKDSIDKLAESTNSKLITRDLSLDSDPGSSIQALEQPSESSRYALQLQKHLAGNPIENSAVMPPAPNGQQSVADSMKSLFPMSSGNAFMNMESYQHDTMPRASIQSQDLGLSLHCLQGQNLNHRSYTDDEVLLSAGPNSIPFEANYQKAEAWSGAGEGENRIGYIFNPHSMPQQLFYSQNLALSQREPLQSNYSHLLHSWNERQLPSVDNENTHPIQQPSMYNLHFGSNFQVPARIHGDEEPSPKFTTPTDQSLAP